MDEIYKITAVIPAYNRINTIKRCLESVINQTYPIAEIIVVDDGSTDGTIEFIHKEYGERVKVVLQDHKGAQAARNVGIKLATGDYIAFLDSDDEWTLNKTELQIEKLEIDNNVVVCGEGLIVFDSKNSEDTFSGRGKNSNNQERKMGIKGARGQIFNVELRRSICLFQALLTSKANLEKIGLLDEAVPSYQEWDTGIRLAERFDFDFVDEPVFLYHMHDGETISKSKKKEIDGLNYIVEKHKESIITQCGFLSLQRHYYELFKRCLFYKDKRFYHFVGCFLKSFLHIR